MKIEWSEVVCIFKLVIIGGAFCELLWFAIFKEWNFWVFGMIFLGGWLGWAIREMWDDIKKFRVMKMKGNNKNE